MTKQEIFNTVWRGLAAQDWEQALNAGGHCRYRGEEGRKCAVGILIPDEEYTQALEPLGVHKLVTVIPALAGMDPDFLAKLQSCHDSDRFRAMQLSLEDLARNEGLSLPLFEDSIIKPDHELPFYRRNPD